MAGITLAQAEAQLAAWLDAGIKTAAGQSVTIGTKQVTRANAAEITNQINFWDGQVKRLSRGGGISVRGVTPV